LTNAYPVPEDQGPQVPAGLIKPGFYTGLNAYQFDGLHVSEIIHSAQLKGVEEVKAGFSFKSLCKAVND
jgi:hypothetical protein